MENGEIQGEGRRKKDKGEMEKGRKWENMRMERGKRRKNNNKND